MLHSRQENSLNQNNLCLLFTYDYQIYLTVKKKKNRM